MAYNFLGLVNDVNRRLNEVELTSANFANALGYYSTVKDAVNAAIREINQTEFEWPFNHETQEETLDVGTVRYFLPYDAKTVDMDSFRIKRNGTFNNKTQRLRIISYEEYIDKYVDAEYTTDGSLNTLPVYVFRTPSLEYGVYPPPNNEYEVVYEYYRLPVDLINATDTPSIPEQFRYVIVHGALIHAYTFRGENDAAGIAKQQFDDGLKNMRSLYINRYDYVRSSMITSSNWK